jgi:hypothetical protein
MRVVSIKKRCALALDLRRRRVKVIDLMAQGDSTG